MSKTANNDKGLCKRKLHKYYNSCRSPRQKHDGKLERQHIFMSHSRPFSLCPSFQSCESSGGLQGFDSVDFQLIVTLHVLLAKSKRNCEAHIVHQYVRHYLLSCCARTLVSFW